MHGRQALILSQESNSHEGFSQRLCAPWTDIGKGFDRSHIRFSRNFLATLQFVKGAAHRGNSDRIPRSRRATTDLLGRFFSRGPMVVKATQPGSRGLRSLRGTHPGAGGNSPNGKGAGPRECQTDPLRGTGEAGGPSGSGSSSTIGDLPAGEGPVRGARIAPSGGRCLAWPFPSGACVQIPLVRDEPRSERARRPPPVPRAGRFGHSSGPAPYHSASFAPPPGGVPSDRRPRSRPWVA